MTVDRDKRIGNPRVFTGKRGRELRAALKRLLAEREKRDRPHGPAGRPPPQT